MIKTNNGQTLNSKESSFLFSLQSPDILNNETVKNIISFINSILNKSELFFLQLQNVLEQTLTKKATKQQKQQLYTLLLKLNLNNNHLSNMLLYYNILTTSFTLNAETKFKLDSLMCNKHIERLQFKKAITYSLNLINNEHFKTLDLTKQTHIIVTHSVILLNINNFELHLKTTNENLKNVVNTINQVYFKILKNTEHPKIKQYLQEYKTFIIENDNLKEIVCNAPLNLPILKLLLEQNECLFAYKQLTNFSNCVELNDYDKLQVQLMLLPILKNKNINEFLAATDHLFEIMASLESSLKRVSNNYTDLVYENYELKSSLKQKELSLKTDSLTNCLNRNAISDVTINFKTDFGAIVFFDLNNLKTLNDSMGHAAGDQYLVEFAKVLLQFKDENISIFRIGGDEFVIIANDYNKDKITKLLNKIVQLTKKPVKILNKKITISFSAGVSLYPDNGTNLNKLVILADKAMYRSKLEKESGNNNYYFA